MGGPILDVYIVLVEKKTSKLKGLPAPTNYDCFLLFTTCVLQHFNKMSIFIVKSIPLFSVVDVNSHVSCHFLQCLIPFKIKTKYFVWSKSDKLVAI